MEFRELNYLITIAEERSISEAAEKLFMAQSSLSQSLQSMEAELGGKLFIRTSTGVRPTQAGEIMLERARKMLVDYRQVRDIIQDMEELKAGQVEFGISTFRGSYLLPGALRSFKRLYPQIHVEITEANSMALEQLLIEENSQELAVKGPLKLKIWKGSEAKRVDLSDFTYGVVLNSQTVKHAMVEVEQPALKKIVTIENKTNYLAMEYDPEILYIYSHGYFSPLEREFLKKLQRVIEGKDVEVFHSGDMDYGGIRIFEYIQKHIFPGIKPLQMDVETYEKYEEYAKTISKETMEKLEKVNVPLLEELKEKLLETGKGIEQESFLIEE